MTEDISTKYLEALMNVFIDSGQIPTFIRNKILVLRTSMRKETQSADISVPIRIQEFSDDELNEEE